MNIFVTDENPMTCALALDDVRVNKMIIETAQLLSTAVLTSPGSEKILPGTLYAICQRNHPCSLWVGSGRENFLWLYNHGLSLSNMFEIKSHRRHSSTYVINRALDYIELLPPGSTPFVNCTPFKDKKDTRTIYEKYRAYLIEKWNSDIRPPKWSGNNKPEWFL